jgi:hypothetical protein
LAIAPQNDFPINHWSLLAITSNVVKKFNLPVGKKVTNNKFQMLLGYFLLD